MWPSTTILSKISPNIETKVHHWIAIFYLSDGDHHAMLAPLALERKNIQQANHLIHVYIKHSDIM